MSGHPEHSGGSIPADTHPLRLQAKLRAMAFKAAGVAPAARATTAGALDKFKRTGVKNALGSITVKREWDVAIEAYSPLADEAISLLTAAQCAAPRYETAAEAPGAHFARAVVAAQHSSSGSHAGMRGLAVAAGGPRRRDQGADGGATRGGLHICRRDAPGACGDKAGLRPDLHGKRGPARRGRGRLDEELVLRARQAPCRQDQGRRRRLHQSGEHALRRSRCQCHGVAR